MKTISYICFASLSAVILWQCYVFASEKETEEYVFALAVEGRITYQTIGDKGETIQKNVRRMELLSSGTVLGIERGASLFLTCAGCNVMKLAYKDSPYTVKMTDFKRVKSVNWEITRNLLAAIKHFIYPDSMPGPRVETGVRTAREIQWCKGFWPSDNEKIIPIGEVAIFEWDSEGTYFFLEIKDFETRETVFSGKNPLCRIEVPVGYFKAGRRYEWFLSEERTAKKRNATFSLIPEVERIRIMTIFNDMPSLLPDDVDNDTRYRLQAGYLCSEGFDYDGWQWLKIKGLL